MDNPVPRTDGSNNTPGVCSSAWSKVVGPVSRRASSSITRVATGASDRVVSAEVAVTTTTSSTSSGGSSAGAPRAKSIMNININMGPFYRPPNAPSRSF